MPRRLCREERQRKRAESRPPRPMTPSMASPSANSVPVWGGIVRFEKRRRQQASGCSGKERPKAQDEVKPVFPEAGRTSPECCGMFQFVTHGVAIQEPHGIVNLGMAYGSMATTCRWKEKRGRGTPCPLFLPSNPPGSRLMGSRLICRRAGAVSLLAGNGKEDA